MLPFFEIGFFGRSLIFHTNTTLIISFLILSLILFVRNFRQTVGLEVSLTLGLATILSGVMGARLFHVIWERPHYFQKHPELIFTRFDGMTFYGGLILAILVFYFLSRTLIKNESLRKWTIDFGAILAAFGYGILRIGCFAEGCCWGSVTDLPWAVHYWSNDSAMPALGLPVHPVQLYDAAGGFLITGILIHFYFRKDSLRPFHLLLLLYPILRFITENFRGDSYRGTQIWSGLSTSQVISIFVIATGVMLCWQNRLRVHYARI